MIVMPTWGAGPEWVPTSVCHTSSHHFQDKEIEAFCKRSLVGGKAVQGGEKLGGGFCKYDVTEESPTHPPTGIVPMLGKHDTVPNFELFTLW